MDATNPLHETAWELANTRGRHRLLALLLPLWLLPVRWVAVLLLHQALRCLPVAAWGRAVALGLLLALPLRTLRRRLLLSVRWVAPILLHQALV
jgi:hypothetical protein